MTVQHRWLLQNLHTKPKFVHHFWTSSQAQCGGGGALCVCVCERVRERETVRKHPSAHPAPGHETQRLVFPLPKCQRSSSERTGRRPPAAGLQGTDGCWTALILHRPGLLVLGGAAQW